MRALATIAGSLAGIVVVAVRYRRETCTPRHLLAMAPVGICVVVALAGAGSALVTLGEQTIGFARAGQVEVARQPMPEALVDAARKELRPGETWTLYTSYGRCRDDARRYFWLAFRLLPNAAKCEGAPSVILAYRIDDLVDALGTPVARDKDWAVIRP